MDYKLVSREIEGCYLFKTTESGDTLASVSWAFTIVKRYKSLTCNFNYEIQQHFYLELFLNMRLAI